MEELKRIIFESEIVKEDDKLWPMPDRDGRQELEIILGGEHICFSVLSPCYNMTLIVFRLPRLAR